MTKVRERVDTRSGLDSPPVRTEAELMELEALGIELPAPFNQAVDLHRTIISTAKTLLNFAITQLLCAVGELKLFRFTKRFQFDLGNRKLFFKPA